MYSCCSRYKTISAGRAVHHEDIADPVRDRQSENNDESYVLPLDAFAHVLFLFLLQDDLNEQLLEFLVAVVDAELLETTRTHTTSILLPRDAAMLARSLES